MWRSCWRYFATLLFWALLEMNLLDNDKKRNFLSIIDKGHDQEERRKPCNAWVPWLGRFGIGRLSLTEVELLWRGRSGQNVPWSMELRFSILTPPLVPKPKAGKEHEKCHIQVSCQVTETLFFFCKFLGHMRGLFTKWVFFCNDNIS